MQVCRKYQYYNWGLSLSKMAKYKANLKQIGIKIYIDLIQCFFFIAL